jgi:anti-sigma B factor antagonist
VRTGEIALDRTEAGLAVLSIRGEHDLNTAPELRRRLREAIENAGAVVVDLSPATFVDSSILGAILDARRGADDAGLGFAVAHGGGNDSVSRVLEVTGLRAELPVHSERDEAMVAASNGLGEASS